MSLWAPSRVDQLAADHINYRKVATYDFSEKVISSYKESFNKKITSKCSKLSYLMFLILKLLLKLRK